MPRAEPLLLTHIRRLAASEGGAPASDDSSLTGNTLWAVAGVWVAALAVLAASSWGLYKLRAR